MKQIKKDILIEELVNILPESVTYLMNKGIKCLACGEPVWGTLESASKEKGFKEEQIEIFVKDLNAILKENHLKMEKR